MPKVFRTPHDDTLVIIPKVVIGKVVRTLVDTDNFVHIIFKVI